MKCRAFKLTFFRTDADLHFPNCIAQEGEIKISTHMPNPQPCLQLFFHTQKRPKSEVKKRGGSKPPPEDDFLLPPSTFFSIRGTNERVIHLSLSCCNTSVMLLLFRFVPSPPLFLDHQARKEIGGGAKYGVLLPEFALERLDSWRIPPRFTHILPRPDWA